MLTPPEACSDPWLDRRDSAPASTARTVCGQTDRDGTVALVADGKDDPAVAFYRRYEFIRFADMAHRLFLPMGTIERLFA